MRWAIGAFALAKLALHLGTFWLYGPHRDELYLLRCGAHLDWGFLDHTPLVPALSALLGAGGARLADALFGAATVALTGLLARRLGGGTAAVALACAAVLVAPVFLYAGGVHSTLAIDQLAWVAAAWLVLEERWVALGLVLGVGFLGKPTILLGAVGLAAGKPRRGLLIAAAIAGVVALPTILWQAGHDWPALAFARASNAAVRARLSPLALLVDQARMIGPLALAAALFAGRRGRPFVIALAVDLALLLVFHGKPYYIAGAFPPLVAAGAVALPDRVRRALLALALPAGAVAVLLTLPVLRPRPVRWNPELVQFADWPGIARQVAAAAGGRPVWTDSYGLAAALEIYTATRVISGANSYHLWGPPPDDPPELLVHARVPDGLCREITLTGVVVGAENRFDVPRPLFVCRRSDRPLRALWPGLARFD